MFRILASPTKVQHVVYGLAISISDTVRV